MSAPPVRELSTRERAAWDDAFAELCRRHNVAAAYFMALPTGRFVEGARGLGSEVRMVVGGERLQCSALEELLGAAPTFRPIEVRGKPVSETIIEERREDRP